LVKDAFIHKSTFYFIDTNAWGVMVVVFGTTSTAVATMATYSASKTIASLFFHIL
jgi:hypothetical protein